jgi:hypothetical protein
MEEKQTEKKVKMLQCPVCQVSIEEKSGRVHFSYGKPSDHDGLYAKVCQYAKNPKCINLEAGKF